MGTSNRSYNTAPIRPARIGKPIFPKNDTPFTRRFPTLQQKD
jgi:hypothetical protein